MYVNRAQEKSPTWFVNVSYCWYSYRVCGKNSHTWVILSLSGDDKADIMRKRSVLCQQIVLFASRNQITKSSLMKAYCSSFYGAILWNLTNASIRDVCVVSRKGLRRIWNLPHNTQYIICSSWCVAIHGRAGLLVRKLYYIDVVSYVERHGVYFGWMLSPIGRNAYFCCSRYGILLFITLHFITKDFVRSYVRHVQCLDVILTVHCLLELLCVRHWYSSLSLFTHNELCACYFSLNALFLCKLTLCKIFNNK